MNITQTLFARLLPTLPEGKITSIHVGLNWTAVLVEVDGETRCGLAATINELSCCHAESAVSRAGHLTELSSRELTELVYSSVAPEVSIGMAAVNALLPRLQHQWVDLHSKEVLAQLGSGKNVAMVGHFPFVPELRSQVGKLWVLEQEPKEDDLPASAAAEIIPQADVLAITAMTLLNRTFDDLMALRRPGVPTLVIGPTTPLSPVMFDIGATILSGAVVENPEAVLRGLSEGANFRQLHRLGVRLVSMSTEKL
jgi:uncharacterized protein